jgi:hypothetical protein
MLITDSSNEINSYKHEINNLRREIENLASENYALNSSLQQIVSENQKLRIQSEILSNNHKSSLYTGQKSEKRSFDHNLSTFEPFDRKFSNKSAKESIVNTQTELEYLERERLNLECQLLKLESEPRTKESALFKELSQKL